MQKIDITPTWAQVIPIFIDALENGNEKQKETARAEIKRVAQVADEYVSVSKTKKN